MADYLPINPEVLRWARERAGFSLDELESSLKGIRRWESGESAPTYPQLQNLADKLKIPTAVFFFPQPPVTPAIEETFRTLPDATLAELPPRVRLLLRKAKAFQINVAELCDGKNPSKRVITKDLPLNARMRVADMAAQVRNYLGITFEVQRAWKNDDTALKEWRDALQSVGIFVFKDAFKGEGYFGFCLTDPEFPLIYVNNSAAKTRQIFTLFHELAHLLFSTSGIDVENIDVGNDVVEIICNRFAAEFLLPLGIFNEARLGRPANEQTAEYLAAQFHVSREFIFRRFLDNNEISQATYAAAARKWAGERRDGSGGDYYRTKLAYLGREYVSLALRAYHQNRISENQLADYLDTRPKNLAGIEGAYTGGVVA